MKPSKLDFDLGHTRFGQPLKLIKSRNLDGQLDWSIVKEAANQRDQRDVVSGLSDRHLVLMAEAACYEDGRRVVQQRDPILRALLTELRDTELGEYADGAGSDAPVEDILGRIWQHLDATA